jgi:hypothetical protein
MKNIILQLVFFFSVINVFSQNNETEYSKFINSKYLSKSQTIKRNDISEKILYLGEIHLKDSLFYIITSFKRVKAAIDYHGHSSIYILDRNKKIIKEYVLDLPEQLPFKIEDNNLCFKYLDEKTKTNKIFIYKFENKIPELLCLNFSTEECF